MTGGPGLSAGERGEGGRGWPAGPPSRKGEGGHGVGWASRPRRGTGFLFLFLNQFSNAFIN